MITSLDFHELPTFPATLSKPWPYDPFSTGASKKKKRRAPKAAAKKELTELYFRFGYLAAQYETLRNMVGLAVSAKQGTLNDAALSSGLKALPHGSCKS